MNALDYVILGLYLVGLLVMGFVLRNQATKEEYFLGGRRIGWKPLSLSVMATQLSAISFVSAPAFVGLREDGGLIWLSYELALPLAMLFLLWKILPSLHASGVVSVYEYLERRFSVSTRLLISGVFQISRAFATGIMIYAISIILQGTIGLAQWESIVLIGVFTLIYSLQGGMSAVVYGDALQMILIVLGTLVCLGFGLYNAGGIVEILTTVDPARLNALNPNSYGFDGGGFGLLPMLFGGFVLYASYYGCDQSEAQRSLSAASQSDLKKIVMAAAFMRFPITVLYCLTGLVIGTFALNTPSFLSQIPVGSPDWMMPIFIINYLPNGVIGILLVAILAAAMSSLSSAINSLSVVTLEDYQRLFCKQSKAANYVKSARITGLGWGLITLLISFYAGDIAPTIIEAINKVGSLFYGPILACFTLGVLTKTVKQKAMNIGILSGVLLNMILWLMFENVFWFWWNLFGFITAVAVSMILTLSLKTTQRANYAVRTPLLSSEDSVLSKVDVVALCCWFTLIISVCGLITYLNTL